MARRGLSVTPNAFRSRSENYTITRADSDSWIAVSASSSNRTVTLLAASTATAGFLVIVSKSDSTANTVTINRVGSDTINGATSLVLSTQYQAVILISNGSNTWNAIVYNPSSGGTGDVVGPASSTANAIARLSGGTSKLLKDTPTATISDAGVISAVGLDLSDSLFLGSYAWASRPSASTAGNGAIIEINNVGNRAVLMRSNGTDWFPLGVQTIYSSTVPISHTGSTGAQTFIAVSIPGDFFHPNAQIRVTLTGGRSAGTAANVVLAARVGANSTSATAIYSNSASNPIQRVQRDLLFQNSRSVQISPAPGGANSFAAGGSVPTDLALNFASEQFFTFGGNVANAADTLTLYQALIEYVA